MSGMMPAECEPAVADLVDRFELAVRNQVHGNYGIASQEPASITQRRDAVGDARSALLSRVSNEDPPMNPDECPRCGGLLEQRRAEFGVAISAETVVCTGPGGNDAEQGCGFSDFADGDPQ